MQQWKNFENRLIFGEDIDNHKVGRFWDTVYIFSALKNKNMKAVCLAASDVYNQHSTTTGWSKKTDPQFYFWDNFGNSAPILTILSLLQAEIYAP